MTANSPLMQPFTLGTLELKNRVVMSPMTRSRADDHGTVPTYAADYYRQRAEAGLIVTEATNISPQAVGNAFTPGIWTEQQAEAWSKVTAAVHAEGGHIFLQLWHTGRISHTDVQPDGRQPVAPSALQAQGTAFTRDGFQPYSMPRALETDEIPSIVNEYRLAAALAKLAGFDGVEIHSANNYLIEQFLRDSTNKRSDAYGGPVENRLRFPLEVAQAVIDVWGASRVGIKLSPTTEVPGGAPLDSDVIGTYGAYIKALSELDLAYLHMVEGDTLGDPLRHRHVDLRTLRNTFKGPKIANNGYDQHSAEDAIRSGQVDLVSFGRLFIANPDLVRRFERGGPFALAAKSYWYGGGQLGYSDWPPLSPLKLQ
jgi:N-ethylmaleimide reductase